jgi:hypothetical protein
MNRTKNNLLMLSLFVGVAAHAADSPEDVFWNSVKKANVAEEYRLYAEQYPRGKYLAETWRRIGQIEGAEQSALAAQQERAKALTRVQQPSIKPNAQSPQSNAYKKTGEACGRNADCEGLLLCDSSKVCISTIMESDDVLGGRECQYTSDCGGTLACRDYRCVKRNGP